MWLCHDATSPWSCSPTDGFNVLLLLFHCCMNNTSLLSYCHQALTNYCALSGKHPPAAPANPAAAAAGAAAAAAVAQHLTLGVYLIQTPHSLWAPPEVGSNP